MLFPTNNESMSNECHKVRKYMYIHVLLIDNLFYNNIYMAKKYFKQMLLPIRKILQVTIDYYSLLQYTQFFPQYHIFSIVSFRYSIIVFPQYHGCFPIKSVFSIVPQFSTVNKSSKAIYLFKDFNCFGILQQMFALYIKFSKFWVIYLVFSL